jgi:hypothetical protein
MFLNLDLKTWLGLTVVGAVVSTLGALFGILLKDYFFSRSFERWKQRQTLELVYQKYRDPLTLSARELASRTSLRRSWHPARKDKLKTISTTPTFDDTSYSVRYIASARF